VTLKKNIRSTIETQYHCSLGDFLRRLYWDYRLSARQVAKVLGCSKSVVLYFMCRHKILRRTNAEAKTGYKASEETKRKMSEVHKGRDTLAGRRTAPFRRKIRETVKKLWNNAKYRKKQSEAHKTPRPDLRRRVTLTCEQCGREFEVVLARKDTATFCSKKCADLSRVGTPAWNKGKSWSEETKRKVSRGVKRLWEDPEYRENQTRAIVEATMRAVHVRPTEPEQQLIDLVEKYNLPYKYVGDGSVIINRFCPDFINYNGQKKIIEVFGDYWHNRPNMPYHRTEKGRKAVFSEYGFETLVIWEHELKEPDKILQRILEFDGSVTGRETPA